jgi:hypothetical protein
MLMNIYDLRRNILVYSFNTHSEGGSIAYTNNGRSNGMALTNIELYKELVAIGSLDENTDPEEFADYTMSQWDALNIAIRFELARETENDLQNSDIFESIAKITKPNI